MNQEALQNGLVIIKAEYGVFTDNTQVKTTKQTDNNGGSDFQGAYGCGCV